MNKVSGERSGERLTKEPAARQFVNFQFLKLDPSYHHLQQNEKVVARQEFLSAWDACQGKDMLLLAYSLTGIRADCDVLFWRVSERLEAFQEMTSRLRSAGLGKYLEPAYSYLAMTRRSIYVDKINPEHDDARTRIVPGRSKYLFVYPFVKTPEWYQLPMKERQEMMDEHIRIGVKYPSVKINTSYSYGLDDQEFVVAFETDQPQDFLDLVMELRESKGRIYTLRDTPTLTCVLKDIRDIVDSL